MFDDNDKCGATDIRFCTCSDDPNGGDGADD